MERERRRKFKLFLPSIIRGNVRSLAGKMDELGALMGTQQEYSFDRDLAAATTLTALCSALRLSRQTETADRALTVKEEDHRAG